jgi:hypothetical protein
MALRRRTFVRGALYMRERRICDAHERHGIKKTSRVFLEKADYFKTR